MLKENNIQKKVLDAIHLKGIPMHSRAYFVLRTALVGIVSVLILAGSFFALSFVFFSVHESGERFLLEFSERGLVTLVALFPWKLFFLFVALLIALGLLIRHFTSAYRFPFLRVFLWALIIGITGSTLIGFTPLHPSLLSASDNDQLPILGPLYESLHDSHQEKGVYRGEITTITDTDFVISHADNDRDSDDGAWIIVPPTGFDFSTLSLGKKVYAAGQLLHGIVYAYGIHFVTDTD